MKLEESDIEKRCRLGRWEDGKMRPSSHFKEFGTERNDYGKS